MDRRNRAELAEDGVRADVSRVQDDLDAVESGEGLGPNQPVRVRDQADEHRLEIPDGGY